MSPESDGEDLPGGWVEVGTVVKPHGVRGGVRIRLHNPASSLDLEQTATLAVQHSPGDQLAPLTVLGRSGEFISASVAGVADRSAAERLRGARLLLQRSSIALERDEYLYVDLIGCQVYEKESNFGSVVDVFCAGASDVLVVRSDEGERMIPLVDDWVVEVDTQRKTIEIRDGGQWEAVKL